MTPRLAAPVADERRESLRETVRRLSSAQKGAMGAPAYSRFVNRPAGRLLAALAFHLGLTPNAVTGISALFTFGGLVLVVAVPPSWPVGVVVAGCLLTGYALDSADGQLARLRGGGSPAGEWLDHMVDAAKASSLHLAVLVGIYRFETVVSGPLLLVPLAYCVIDVVTYFGTMLNESLRARHGVPTRAQPTGQRVGVGRSCSPSRPTTGCCAVSSCSSACRRCSSRPTPCSSSPRRPSWRSPPSSGSERWAGWFRDRS